MESDKITPDITLNNNIKMPRIGLGTHKIENCAEIVYESIKSGCRLIDTASVYQNEKQVGQGIKKAIDEGIVKREDLFVVTKIWTQDKHRVDQSIKYQLGELGLDYVDLYLDHWPFCTWIDDDTKKEITVPSHVFWPKMEELVHKGQVKSLGVSNYNVQLLADLLAFAKIKPVVNQFELHPYLAQTGLVNYCLANNVYPMAYNSICRGSYAKKKITSEVNLLEDSVMKQYAEKYGVTTGILALNWALSRNCIVIPGTSNPKRMGENLKALNFKLSEEDLKCLLEKLDKNFRFNGTSDWGWSKNVDIFA
jgi:diketogulonate reductase-like aldo/keto reductase